jgi:hypothetical protein
VLIATAVAMYSQSTGFFNRLRRAAGLSWFDGRREHAAEPPVPHEELLRVQASGRPLATTTLGVLPIALILWLMMFKPF